MLLAQKVSRSQRNSLDALSIVLLMLFGRISRTATEDVVLHLLQTKCMLIYHATRMHSADYAVARCLSVCPSVCHT